MEKLNRAQRRQQLRSMRLKNDVPQKPKEDTLFCITRLDINKNATEEIKRSNVGFVMGFCNNYFPNENLIIEKFNGIDWIKIKSHIVNKNTRKWVTIV